MSTHPASSRNGRTEVRIDANAIDAIFSEMDRHSPGAAVGIAQYGRPVYRNAFGVANLELPIALSPSIRMRLGSTSKHFTCLAYLLLCEQGLAALDEPIREYLPTLSPTQGNVSARQLMAHVSGLRDAKDIVLHLSGTQVPVSCEALTSMYESFDDVNFLPGTAWSYNNGGYQLLTAAIEHIAHCPLERVLDDLIFQPVGMYDTRLRRVDTDFASNSAALHYADSRDSTTQESPGHKFRKRHHGVASAGEGGIVSTVDDMLRWLAHMNEPRVGSSQTWAAMLAPARLLNGTSTGYGLGLMVGEYRDLPIIHHAGTVRGGSSQMLKVPSLGLDIVVMVNRYDISAALLAERILDTCVPNPAVSRDAHPPLATGVFQSPRTGRVFQLSTQGHRQVASIDGSDMFVAADANGVLRPMGASRHLRIALTLHGDPEVPRTVTFEEFGELDQMDRLPSNPAASAGNLFGRYQSIGAQTKLLIHPSDTGPRLTSVGRFGSVEYLLEPLAMDVWRMRPGLELDLGGIVASRGERGLEITTARTRRLPFRRVA